jgi:fatty acid/phospholipid biosynthesis enzyme
VGLFGIGCFVPWAVLYYTGLSDIVMGYLGNLLLKLAENMYKTLKQRRRKFKKLYMGHLIKFFFGDYM